MDNEKNDGKSFPEVAELAEVDHFWDDITSLTRRSFLVGTGSIAGAYATGGFAAGAEPSHRWLIYRSPDPRADGRSVVGISFDDRASSEEDLRWCFLPEVSFGEYAKATVQPLESKNHGVAAAKKLTDAYDAQVVFSGLELARHGNEPNYFSLIFRFIHTAYPNRPRIDIAVRDLLSPTERTLAEGLSLSQWRSLGKSRFPGTLRCRSAC
jgi:hypothetical protein